MAADALDPHATNRVTRRDLVRGVFGELLDCEASRGFGYIAVTAPLVRFSSDAMRERARA